MIEIDEILKNRIKNIKTKRDEQLMQISDMERKKTLPIGKISKTQINAFAKALKSRFNDPDSNFGKGYLQFLVSEIKVEKKQLTIRGSKRALAEVVSSLNPKNTATTVPSYVLDWRARQDYDLHPCRPPLRGQLTLFAVQICSLQICRTFNGSSSAKTQ